jgi:hypothetical protein
MVYEHNLIHEQAPFIDLSVARSTARGRRAAAINHRRASPHARLGGTPMTFLKTFEK